MKICYTPKLEVHAAGDDYADGSRENINKREGSGVSRTASTRHSRTIMWRAWMVWGLALAASGWKAKKHIKSNHSMRHSMCSLDPLGVGLAELDL